MTEKKEMPSSAKAALLWLECKHVIRGFKSDIFPDLTKEEAIRIRQSSLEELERALEEADAKSNVDQ